MTIDARTRAEIEKKAELYDATKSRIASSIDDTIGK